MFYVLNFKTHQFRSAEYPEEAIKFAEEEIETHKLDLDEDELEIVDASDIYARWDYEGFKESWS